MIEAHSKGARNQKAKKKFQNFNLWGVGGGMERRGGKGGELNLR